jgi:rhamnose utilization protein RhaD (predicted bifunctional aldolase and dehydrogenase)
MTQLPQLVELSARIGKNLDPVQAGGGNTSIKDNGTLWVKASGKWLIHTVEDDMFLLVPLADIERQLVHVHSVRTIAWAAQETAANESRR